MGDMRDLPVGFADPVDDAQTAFRAALRALSRPGERVECLVSVPNVPGLMPATAALLLALTDHETPVWWARDRPAPWLQFHTGAPAVTRPEVAAFAVVTQDFAAPDLTRLNAGTDDAPERSATLVFELPTFEGGAATEWSGPGLREPKPMHLAGLPAGFWAQWQHNHAGFPSGVDVFFVCGRLLVGLPRTTRVQIREGA